MKSQSKQKPLTKLCCPATKCKKKFPLNTFKKIILFLSSSPIIKIQLFQMAGED